MLAEGVISKELTSAAKRAIAEHLSDGEIQKLWEKFKAVDKDGEGYRWTATPLCFAAEKSPAGAALVAMLAS